MSTLPDWLPIRRMPGGNYVLIYELGTMIRDCMIIFINDLKSGCNQDGGGGYYKDRRLS